jgi:hypothetical protein
MDIAQIQIVPVDNGFFIQVVNADGSGTLNPRKVAVDRKDLVKQVKELAEQLYTKEPPKSGAPSQPSPIPPADTDGTTRTKTVA